MAVENSCDTLHWKKIRSIALQTACTTNSNKKDDLTSSEATECDISLHTFFEFIFHTIRLNYHSSPKSFSAATKFQMIFLNWKFSEKKWKSAVIGKKLAHREENLWKENIFGKSCRYKVYPEHILHVTPWTASKHE